MKQDFVVEKSIMIKAPVSKVWKALTTPEIIKKYFFGTDAKSDWKKGSPVTFSGEWQGKTYQDKGTILEVEPEKLLKYNHFSNLSGKEDKPENYNNVTYKLDKEGDGTKLTIVQDNNANELAKEQSEKNWKMVMEGLKKEVEK
jgi:uncharacterized protein YndB with AHSA1/START domain